MTVEPKSPCSINAQPAEHRQKCADYMSTCTLMKSLAMISIGCMIIGLMTDDTPSDINKSRTISGEFNTG